MKLADIQPDTIVVRTSGGANFKEMDARRRLCEDAKGQPYWTVSDALSEGGYEFHDINTKTGAVEYVKRDGSKTLAAWITLHFEIDPPEPGYRLKAA